jgi:hypothetical protein
MAGDLGALADALPRPARGRDLARETGRLVREFEGSIFLS